MILDEMVVLQIMQVNSSATGILRAHDDTLTAYEENQETEHN